LVTERERIEGRLNRLVERNTKVLREIMKSKTTKLQKADSYEFFFTFISGLCCHLEDKYPYLKKEITHNKNGEPRWAKPAPENKSLS
jgi:hypothetical protein